MSGRPKLPDRKVWRVRIPAHVLRWDPPGHPERARTWRIPATEADRYEEARDSAVALAVLEAHIVAGVPALKSFRRASAERVSCQRITVNAMGVEQ